MLKKRGQVSTFVIIGVLVLFVFIFIFMLRDSIREKFRGSVDREAYLNSEMNQIKKTVNTCLVKETDKAVKLLGENGGYFNPEDYVTYHGTKIAKLCENIPKEKICNAKPLSLENTNKILKDYLKPQIKNCIDLNSYRKKDYELETGELDVVISVKNQEVIVELNYPITIKLENFESKNEKIISNLKLPLGRAIELTNSILSQEANNGDLDVMTMSLLSRGEFTIRERKSYPNKFYIIDLNNGLYKFNIGIEGEV